MSHLTGRLRPVLACAALVALSLPPTLTLGAEPAAPASAPRFAVGTGLGWTGEGAGSNALAGLVGAGLGGLSGSFAALPVAVLNAEVRVGATNWLMAGVSARYATTESGAPADFAGLTSTVPLVSATSMQVGAAVGLRHVHNRGGAVEVSTYARLSVRRTVSVADVTPQSTAQSAAETTSTTRSAMELAGSAGIVLDKRLTDALWLRFTTPVLFGGTTSTEERGTGATGADKGDSNGRNNEFGLRFAPTLTLRLAF